MFPFAKTNPTHKTSKTSANPTNRTHGNYSNSLNHANNQAKLKYLVNELNQLICSPNTSNISTARGNRSSAAQTTMWPNMLNKGSAKDSKCDIDVNNFRILGQQNTFMTNSFEERQRPVTAQLNGDLGPVDENNPHGVQSHYQSINHNDSINAESQY